MEGDQTDAATSFEAVSREFQQHGPRLPRATYRVQFNRHFTFRQATELVPYLCDLGISDLYASPFFKARPDSQHGYDTVDHNALSDAIGTEAELDALTTALHERGMGLVLDFVPNHMGIGGRDNRWWTDVLENGPSSEYAAFFDIDWRPLKTELARKVLLPILGDHYGRVLERGELKLSFEYGGFVISYGEHLLPANPDTYSRILERAVEPVSTGLGPDADAVLELHSIMTGLSHLPKAPELGRAKIRERRREKEILRHRLATLVAESPEVARALGDVLAGFNGAPGSPHTFDALHRFLEAQSFRLSYWRVAAEEVNYRRFFDVSDLAAIRMENPAVFQATHRKLLQLLQKGQVTGLRIDHPDGLWDPTGYFSTLQRACFLEHPRPFTADTQELAAAFDEYARTNPRSSLARPLYLVAEKILARGELLPAEWPVHGTSGYDFGTLVGGLFVDPAGERPITDAYEEHTGLRQSFNALACEKKKLVLQTSLASELNVLAAALNRLSERDRHSRDFTLGSLTDALREVIACFPVYRTYATERTQAITEHDRLAVTRAIRMAKQRNPTTDASVFDFVHSILSLEVPETVAAEDRHLWREFVMRFQQLTAPVMAKGLEDTTFYVYNRLTSLNEVGGEPERFGTSVASFHQANAHRLREWPYSLLATSTHDTKRSEDVRARISVLSELPDRWHEALLDLRGISRRLKVALDDEWAPSANDEYLFYQTLLGVWPQGPLEGAMDETLTERLVAYMRKATREAKVSTSWVNPVPEYEAATEQFVRRALEPGSRLLDRLAPLARDVAYFGRWSSLSQTLLKLTAPGVPDTYQGTETWDFSLVDPDNRRPVDFRLRREMLDEIRRRRPEGLRFVRELVEHVDDGRIKLFVTQAALELRRQHPALFGAEGQYVSVEARGPRSEQVVGFTRLHPDNAELLVLAPRFIVKLVHGRPVPPLDAVWEATSVPIGAGSFRSVFTGEEITTEDHDGIGHLPLARVFRSFPLGLLERISRGRPEGIGIVTVPRLGAWKTAGGVAWRVWAPAHERVEVALFEGGQERESFPLNREGSFFARERPALPERVLYKLRVDGAGPFPDPWSRAQPFGVHGPSEVPGERHPWSDDGWRGVPLEELIIYELHLGTATTEGTFEALIPHLPHIQSLGATAIELMPVAGFPGRRNWGYDGVSLFAPCAVYGGPEGLRRLIDAAHALRLGVLIDVVYNHLGPDGNYLGCFSREYFTTRHVTPWGEAINFDGGNSAPVRELVLSNAEMWIRDYHADGLRLDATHAIIDDSEPHILKAIAERARAAAPDRCVLVIAEDDRNEARLLRRDSPGDGLDAVWADDFHHSLRRNVAGDSAGYFRDYSGTTEELTTTIRQGWLFEGRYSDHFHRPRGTSAAAIDPAQFIYCIQNHDQIGNRALGDRLAASPGLHRVMSALLFFSPATPLLFMGQEWNASTPFLYFTDHHDQLGRQVTLGRRTELLELGTPPETKIPDPQSDAMFECSRLDWRELDIPGHRLMLEWYRWVIELRKTHPCLRARGRENVEVVALTENTLRIVRRSGERRLTLLACLRGELNVVTSGRIIATSEEVRFGGRGELRQDAERLVAPGPIAVVFEE